MTYPAKELTPIPLPFGGGLNTKPGYVHIEAKYSPNCKNVYSGLSTILQRRNDYLAVAASTTENIGNGIQMFKQDDDTQMLMAYIDNQLYKMDNVSTEYDGTLDAITFGTGMSSAIMEFEQIEESGTRYIVMATHDRDKLQKYDGTTCTDLSTDTDLVKPKFIKYWRGYLFCANIEDNESRVYYNDVAYSIVGATAWGALDYQTVATNDGDVITGLATLRGRLYTFKNNSIHRWTYLGGTPLFSVVEIISGIGTSASRSIVNVNHPKYGNVLIFLSSDARLYAFDGNDTHLLSDNIENDNGISEFSLAKINTEYISGACALDYQTRHWYVIWAPTAATNNWCLIYNYYTDAFYPFDNMDATSCCIGKDGGKFKPYFIHNDGEVNQMDYADTTTRTIAAHYDTTKLDAGILAMLKRQSYMDLHCKNVPSGEITLYHKSDWAVAWAVLEAINVDDGGFILGTSKLGIDLLGGRIAKSKTVDVPFISHSEEFRIVSSDSNNSWAIFAAYLLTRPVGYGKGVDD